MFCFDWICEPELDTKGSSDATGTDTKETSRNSEGEESVTVEEAKKGKTGDAEKLIPASQAVSPRPGST